MTWRDTALQDAKDRDPWEAVGLVVVVKGRRKYWACRKYGAQHARHVCAES